MSEKVVSLESRRYDPHCSGTAKCLACAHEWVAVARIGVFELECPQCHCQRGVFMFPVALPKRSEVFTCKCDCQHMYISHHPERGYAISCVRCGAEHSVDTVFPR